MSIITDETLMKFGFTKDENNSQLKEFFKNDFKLKEVHVDIYPDNPMLSFAEFMLLLRLSENNAVVSNDGNRLILKKNDANKTHFMNVLYSKIAECFIKKSETYFEFILNIQNIYYKITILN